MLFYLLISSHNFTKTGTLPENNISILIKPGTGRCLHASRYLLRVLMRAQKLCVYLVANYHKHYKLNFGHRSTKKRLHVRIVCNGVHT